MIKDNIRKLRQRIADACLKANIDPGKITIVGISKGRTVLQVQEAVEAGLSEIGENRLQEALEKFRQISGVVWHMVGHLQSNKAKDAVKIFSLIHSVDSIDLAGEINKQAVRANKIQDILLEVKTSPEATKFGIAPQAVGRTCTEIFKFKNLNLKGLMTIAPIVSNKEESRPYFACLRRLKEEFNPGWLLSMGMSDDFEIAIEEGADIIRLGRAVFEE